MLGFFFHPLYMVANAVTCGHLGAKYLAGFGLGSLTLGLMVISIDTCFSMTVSTLVAQAAGAKDLTLCRVYLNR